MVLVVTSSQKRVRVRYQRSCRGSQAMSVLEDASQHGVLLIRNGRKMLSTFE